MRTVRLAASALATLVLLLVAAPPPASAAPAAGGLRRAASHPYVSGRVLVKFKPGVARFVRAAAVRRAGATAVQRIPQLGVDVLRPRDAAATVAALRARPDVLWAEAESLARRAAELAPPERTELGVAPTHAANAATKGTGVKVGVIDDGVWAVADLTGRVHDGGDCSSGACRAKGGVNANAGSHGTAVATIIAAKDGNGIGIAGVVPNAVVYSYRVFADARSGASDAAIAAAIVKAADDNVAVVNLSLVTPFDSRTLRDAVAYARAKRPDLVLVAASGNEGTELTNYPAGNPGVVSVGAAQRCGPGAGDWCLASFSTRGDVDVIAPGVAVRAWYTDDAGAPPEPTGSTCTATTLSCVSGTSFAAPMVSGIVAGLAGAGIRGDRARAAVLSSARLPTGTSAVAAAYGQGRANMKLAYDTAVGTATYNAAFVDRGAYVGRTVGRRRVEVVRVDPTPTTAPNGAPTLTPAAGGVTAVSSTSTTVGSRVVHRALFDYTAPGSGTATTLAVGAAGDPAETLPLALLPANAGPEGEPIGAALGTTAVTLTYGSRTKYVRSVALSRGQRLRMAFDYPVLSETSLLLVWLPGSATGGGGATDAPVAVGFDTQHGPGPDNQLGTGDDVLTGVEQFVAPVSGTYTFGFLLFTGPYEDEFGDWPGDNGTYRLAATISSARVWQQLPNDAGGPAPREGSPWQQAPTDTTAPTRRPTGGLRAG